MGEDYINFDEDHGDSIESYFFMNKEGYKKILQSISITSKVLWNKKKYERKSNQLQNVVSPYGH